MGTARDGLYHKSEAGLWTRASTADGLASDQIAALALLPDGALAGQWLHLAVGHVGNGISLLTSSGWLTLSPADGLGSYMVSALATNGQRLWIGHPTLGTLAQEGGLSVLTLTDGSASRYGTLGTLPSPRVTALTAAGNDGAWLAVGDSTRFDGVLTGGLVQMRWPAEDATAAADSAPAWTTYTTDDGLAHSDVRAVAVWRERVWAGTAAGISVQTADGWDTYLAGTPVNALLATERALWLATAIGVIGTDGQRWRSASAATDVLTLAEDSAGRLWLGGPNGLQQVLNPFGSPRTYIPLLTSGETP